MLTQGAGGLELLLAAPALGVDCPEFALELRMQLTMGAMVECLMISKSVSTLRLVVAPPSPEVR